MTREGWWINPDGRVVEVYEHMEAVLAAPDVFGRAPKRQRNETAEKYRESILESAMQRGWIRVRGHGDFTTFEYWRWSPEVADAAWDFLADVLGASTGTIRMGEVESGRTFSATVSDFLAEPRKRRNPSPQRPNPARELYLLGRSVGQGRGA